VRAKGLDWRNYVDESGDFELAHYIFRVLNDLMKQSLDLGTLLSDDQSKLRAYKDQVKVVFRRRWQDVAQALESFEIIVPCGCPPQEFCRLCGGSRYRLNETLSPDRMREIAVVTGPGTNGEVSAKLAAGLEKALAMFESHPQLFENDR